MDDKYLKKRLKEGVNLFNDNSKLIDNKWNKKAFEYLDDIGIFLLVSVILLGAIVVVMWVFYSVGGDVRGVEAQTLAIKLVDSVVENGYFKEDVFDEDFDKYDLMTKAGVDKKVIQESGDFYFNLGIYKNGQMEKEFKEGKGGFEVSCKLEGSSKNIPKCYEKKFVVFNNNEKFVVKILTASNQGGNS